jgi:hypothetical protein
MEFWGCDELGMQRRAYRFAEMTAAARVLAEMANRVGWLSAAKPILDGARHG